MKITTYFQNNKKELILLLIILLAKSVVQLFAFPGSFWLIGIRVVLFFIAFVLALIIIDKWNYKLMTIALIVLFSFAQGQLKLWKIPAMVYVNKLNNEYREPINYVVSDDSIRSIHYNPREGMIVLKGKNYCIDSTSISNRDKRIIIELIKETEVVEIEKDKYCTLFVLNRFIDNGSGLLYSIPENIKHIRSTKYYRINGFDITGCTKIWGNWYYISFT